jgi:Polyketide cyclase / dehydrase and lipid transport
MRNFCQVADGKSGQGSRTYPPIEEIVGMASVRREIITRAGADDVWSAIRDVGALHTRLVPGFVTDTKLDGPVRIVTFGNGTVVREPIVTLDDQARRLVWSAEGGITKHYNASVQVSANDDGSSKVVWIADFLPDSAAGTIASAIDTGMAVMKKTLDRLA